MLTAVSLLLPTAHVRFPVRLTRSPLTRHPQKKLSGHPNIVQFCSAASIGKEESDTGQAEFLLLTELCRGNELPAGVRRSRWREALPRRTGKALSHRREWEGPSAFCRVPGGVMYMTEEDAVGLSLPTLPMEGRGSALLQRTGSVGIGVT